jgi:hypothetical protein
MTQMPAKSDVTTEQLTSYLSSNFGNDINAAQVQDACGVFGITYATATKRLRDFYVKRGTWNLTVQEKLEQTYNAPAAIKIPDQEIQNLIPSKDKNYVPFGNFSDVKKSFSLVCSILLSSLVSLVTVRLSLLSKHVLN